MEKKKYTSYFLVVGFKYVICISELGTGYLVAFLGFTQINFQILKRSFSLHNLELCQATFSTVR